MMRFSIFDFRFWIVFAALLAPYPSRFTPYVAAAQQRYALIDENGVLKEHGFVDYPSLANRIPVPEDFRMEPGKAQWNPVAQTWQPYVAPPTPPPLDPDVDIKTALDRALADPLITPALKDLFTAWKARLEASKSR